MNFPTHSVADSRVLGRQHPLVNGSAGEADPLRLNIGLILVPVDFTSRSRQLVREASSLARQLGAGLALLHVYEPVTYAPAHTTPQELDDWSLALERDAQSSLRQFRAEFSDDPVIERAQLLVAGGDLQAEIFEIAQSIRASLIVVSTHAYSGIKHLLLRSKAAGIIRRAGCPVLVIPVSDRPGRRRHSLGLARREAKDDQKARGEKQIAHERIA
jgi:universal stress protein A